MFRGYLRLLHRSGQHFRGHYPHGGNLGWDVAIQGAVLSSFYIGYLLMQIGGGGLADKFGGKLILGLRVLIWSIFTIITPTAAFMGLSTLFLARIGMGLGEAVTFPSELGWP